MACLVLCHLLGPQIIAEANKKMPVTMATTHLGLVDCLETLLDVAIHFQLTLEHDARNTAEYHTY